MSNTKLTLRDLPDLSDWSLAPLLTLEQAALLWGGIDPAFSSYDNVGKEHHEQQCRRAIIAMQAFLGGIVLKTLQVHELFLIGEDGWQNSYSYRANQAKDEFSIRDIDPKRTTVQKMVLIAWAQKEDCLTLKQDLIKRERQMRGASDTERRIETQRQPESTEKPIIQLLDYTPKHPTPEYQVATEVIKEFYDPIPEGGKPPKALVIQDFIAQRLKEITGVKPLEAAIRRVDTLARSPDFKNQTKTKK